MSDWPCELQQFEGAEENNPARRHGLYGDWTSNGAAGVYINTDEGALIGYSSSQLDKPGALVATLAHELCHYMLQTAARSHPPGGWKDHELHTDTACGFMGFGIFSCNAAFDFQQWGGHGDSTTGWSSSRQGYLSESEHAYSLALFCVLTGTEPRTVGPHLKKNPRVYFDLALQDIETRPADITRLLNVRSLPRSLPPILSVESPLDAPEDTTLEGPAAFTPDDVAALGPQKPWYLPLTHFYLDLIATQEGAFSHAREFAALELLQPLLRDALLVIRFTQRFDEQGLQGAIILEEADEPDPSLRMLELTVLLLRLSATRLAPSFCKPCCQASPCTSRNWSVPSVKTRWMSFSHLSTRTSPGGAWTFCGITSFAAWSGTSREHSFTRGNRLRRDRLSQKSSQGSAAAADQWRASRCA